MTSILAVISIIVIIAVIIYIISRRNDNDSWFGGFLDALLISDLIQLIGKIFSSVGSWSGSGGGFSGGGSSGSWDFDFDLDD